MQFQVCLKMDRQNVNYFYVCGESSADKTKRQSTFTLTCSDPDKSANDVEIKFDVNKIQIVFTTFLKRFH